LHNQGSCKTEATNEQFLNNLFIMSSTMKSLDRMKLLGQIKGMCYEPTPSDVYERGVAPNCYDASCRDFDMDYFNTDFQQLWGDKDGGRDDLKTISGQGVNMMRLYNWTGNEAGGATLRNHISFLDHCATNNLKVAVPFSNYNTTISATNAQNTANSIVNELTTKGVLHSAVALWQVTNEFELGGISPETVATLIEYIIRAEEAAGITDDSNKIPIVVATSTAIEYGYSEQSIGATQALQYALQDGGTLKDGTVVTGNTYLSSRNVWTDRFAIGVQSFQYATEIADFTTACNTQFPELPIMLTEHGFDSVSAATATGGNKGTHDDVNQGKIVATQISNCNALHTSNDTFRGMCVFQWLNTYYKCGNSNQYSNTCTEGNFGQVQWCDFGASQPTNVTPTGTTTSGQSFPIDPVIKKTAVFDAVTNGF
jgi:hypothetical protein